MKIASSASVNAVLGGHSCPPQLFLTLAFSWFLSYLLLFFTHITHVHRLTHFQDANLMFLDLVCPLGALIESPTGQKKNKPQNKTQSSPHTLPKAAGFPPL